MVACTVVEEEMRMMVGDEYMVIKDGGKVEKGEGGETGA